MDKESLDKKPAANDENYNDSNDFKLGDDDTDFLPEQLSDEEAINIEVSNHLRPRF